jgi:hypothetical protein
LAQAALGDQAKLPDTDDDWQPDPDFIICRENWAAWLVWQDVKDQWRVAPMGGFLGLDGAFVLDWLRLQYSNPERIQRLYRDVRLISNGFLKALNDERATSKS